jgi:serine protease Do
MNNDDNSWQSGIRFDEEKKPKRFLRILGIICIAFFSASIGGIFGGYYVKKNYDTSYFDSAAESNNTVKNTDTNNMLPATAKSSNMPESSITKVANIVGPAVVGVDNNVTTWGSGTGLQGSGSGIIFDKEGYIVTNEHVIDGASNISVTLSGGRKVSAKLVGKDSQTDLAVLKINVENLPVAKFGNSSNVRIGDTAVAIGNPLGEEFSGTVTVGVISALNRSIDVDGREYKVIQTDASINYGNSGGALCNEAGEVIGINSLKINSAEGMGFAISINEARPIIQAIMKKGYVSRPSLGIVSQFINKNTAAFYSVPVGVYIKELMDNGVSRQLSLQAGDIITVFEKKEIQGEDELPSMIEKHKVGDIVSIRVWRAGKYLNLKVKLGDSYGQ